MPGRRISRKSSKKSRISLTKSLKRKSLRKSIRKSLRKSLRKSVRKSRESVRKQRGGRKLNAYFKTMLSAKRKNLPKFSYKGKTYKQLTTKTGMKIYKHQK